MTPDPLWLVLMFSGTGSTLIAFLLKRAVADHDKALDEHDKAITALKVDVAKAQGGVDGLAEQLRVLRHDVRDIKAAVDGIATHILQLLRK